MLTEDLKIIAEALTKSKNLEVDSTGTMVRRIAPLPETDTTLQRSIYAVCGQLCFLNANSFFRKDFHKILQFNL